MHQWQVDQKRHYVNEKSRQLSLLAEVCALLAAFSTIMLYELGLPSPSDYWYSDVLLALWAISTLSVPCINLCIMVISAMINFEILEVSSKEIFREALADASQYVTEGMAVINHSPTPATPPPPMFCRAFAPLSQTLDHSTVPSCRRARRHCIGFLGRHPPPDSSPTSIPRRPETSDEYNPFAEDGKPQNLDTNGIINLPRRFLHWWHATEYDTRFRHMCLAFSYTLPVFMANLALTTLIKFFQYQTVCPAEPNIHCGVPSTALGWLPLFALFSNARRRALLLDAMFTCPNIRKHHPIGDW